MFEYHPFPHSYETPTYRPSFSIGSIHFRGLGDVSCTENGIKPRTYLDLTQTHTHKIIGKWGYDGIYWHITQKNLGTFRDMDG